MSYGVETSCACNAYVYAWRSTEYRLTFKKVKYASVFHVHYAPLAAQALRINYHSTAAVIQLHSSDEL